MKTRIISIILLCALCFSLAACGSGGEKSSVSAQETSATEAPAQETSPEASSASEPTPEATEETPAEEATGFVPVQLPLTDSAEELSLWLRLSPFLMMYNVTDLSKATFYAEMEKRTGVVVNVTSVPIFMANEQFNFMMAGGELPDMIDSFALLYPQGVDHAVDEGLILDMNDFLHDWMPNYEHALTLNPQFTQDSLSAEGRLTHANTLFIEDEGVTVGMFIRRDWLDKLDMDLPVTYDDYYETLTAFKTELGKSGAFDIMYQGCTVNITGGYETVAFYTEDEETLPFMNIDGVASFGPINDGYRKYLETMAKWFDEGLLFQDYMTDTNRSTMMEAGICSDEIGLFTPNRDDLSRFHASVRTIDPDATLGGAYDMRATEDQEIHVRYPSQTIIYGIAISGQCKNVELAAKWLDYCYSEEGTILCNYGVEGEGLQYDENGNPEYTDLVLHNPEMSSIACCAIYSKYGGAMLCYGRRNFGAYDQDVLDLSDFWEESGDYDYVYPAKAGMTTEESEEISSYMAEIRSYVIESTNKFITGGEPLNDETWATYVQTLKDLGVDRVVELKQAALDRYTALGEKLAA